MTYRIIPSASIEYLHRNNLPETLWTLWTQLARKSHINVDPLTSSSTTPSSKFPFTLRKSNIKKFVSQNIRTKEGPGISENLNPGGEKNELEALSAHLMNLKTSCSQVKKDIALKEISAYRYKNESCFKSDNARCIQSSREELEKKIEKLNESLGQINGKKEVVTLGVKSYEHILERMKKDDINFQLKRNDLKKQEGLLEKELKELERRFYSAKEFEQLAINGLLEASEKHKEEN